MYTYAVSASCKKRGIFLGDIANRAWFRAVLFDELESAMAVLRWGGVSVSALSFPCVRHSARLTPRSCEQRAALLGMELVGVGSKQEQSLAQKHPLQRAVNGHIAGYNLRRDVPGCVQDRWLLKGVSVCTRK